jgi:hypothetical protein
MPVDDPLPGKLQPAPASLTQFDQRLRKVPRHHSSSLMTGRVGYVRATSVNPAAENIADSGHANIPVGGHDGSCSADS